MFITMPQDVGILSLMLGLVLLTAATGLARPSGAAQPDISQLHTDGEKLSRLNLVRAVAANVVCPQPDGCPATVGHLVQLPIGLIEVRQQCVHSYPALLCPRVTFLPGRPA